MFFAINSAKPKSDSKTTVRVIIVVVDMQSSSFFLRVCVYIQRQRERVHFLQRVVDTRGGVVTTHLVGCSTRIAN